MFVDRRREDRLYGAARSGLLDLAWDRVRDWWAGRERLRTAGRVFAPERDLRCRLHRGEPLSMTGMRYCRVTCLRGAAWVTVTGDARDRVLGPGQSLTLTRSGKMLLSGGEHGAEIRLGW